MNSGTMTGIVTVMLLALFLYGCFWAWSANRKADFDEAALQPLEDEIVKGEHP